VEHTQRINVVRVERFCLLNQSKTRICISINIYIGDVI
jgi:hypothetical protein